MTLKLITGPAAEPITLTEAKLHLRVEHTVDDDLITALIQAAREQAEHLTGRSLITQTWAQVLDAFPAAEIELGRPPVASITSITYVDPNGDTQTMSSSDYSLDSTTTPGYVLPAATLAAWPNTLDTANAVTVTFVSGYGDAADVPAAVKAWMKLHIGTLYKQREGIAAGVSVASLPDMFVDRLLDPFRVWGV